MPMIIKSGGGSRKPERVGKIKQIDNMKKGNALLLLIAAFTLWGLNCHAQSSETQEKVSPLILQHYVGRWYPDRIGWHGCLDFSINDGKLILTMETDEGPKRFEDVKISESGTKIEWSYCDEIDAVWYIGTWSETKRKEIIVNINRIIASCGIPTEVYINHDEATHAKHEWKYSAEVVNDKLIMSNTSKIDYFSRSGELMFTKSMENKSIIKYRR